MAKVSMIEREKKRQKLVDRYAAKRAATNPLVKVSEIRVEPPVQARRRGHPGPPVPRPGPARGGSVTVS